LYSRNGKGLPTPEVAQTLNAGFQIRLELAVDFSDVCSIPSISANEYNAKEIKRCQAPFSTRDAAGSQTLIRRTRRTMLY
jgi:hypothetical protein